MSGQRSDTETQSLASGSWLKIGEHSSSDALRLTVKKLRAKWVGRYEFQICRSEHADGYELQLRHR